MPTLSPIMTHPDAKRQEIRDKVVAGLKESFPIKARNKTIEVDHVQVQPKTYSSNEEKAAILKGDTLFENVKGTVRMRDETGKVIDELPNFTLLRLPYFTPRHTFVIGGNEYSVSNMVRRKPGVYARKRANGILEAAFNTQGGSNFRISMDPEKGEPRLEYASTKIPLYPILRKAGISHDTIAEAWGRKLTDKNRDALFPKADQAVDKLYKKEVPSFKQQANLTSEEKMKEILQRHASAMMDPEVNQQTLGKPYTNVNPGSLLDASAKVLRIFNNTEDVDDQDNLDFKHFVSVDDLFKERIKLDAREIAKKLAIKMEGNPDLRRAMPSGPFTKGLLDFINTSQLVSVPTQTNPVELVDSAVRVTSLGEGGISTERAIPMEARQTHPTQLGAIDPIRTPESFRAGIDLRTAMLSKRDAEGNIYVPVYDVKQGKHKDVRAGELMTKVVAFPHQELKGKVDALVGGVLRKVPATHVDYQIPHSSVMYSPTTNLVPFMSNIQGNRAIMASKMQTQAISLTQREAPHVQVASPSGHSFEKMMAHIINPVSPVAGKVVKIDDDFIHIRPHTKKTSAPGKAKDDGIIKVPYNRNFPLASKTHLDHEIIVKPGDDVKENQLLAESNFTRDGVLALGKNMRVAFMPYYGTNVNDAIAISEGAAKKLTSERMYKVVIPKDPDLTFNRDKHEAYYGHGYTKEQYKNLDKDGVVKPGATIHPGDPIVVGLRKAALSADDLILGRLHKSLANPNKEFLQDWGHDHPGQVIDVVKTPKRIAFTVKTQEPAMLGDKLSGRYGNKGVIAHIIPDDQMIKDSAGNPIDMLLPPSGVVSRINPGQILETAIGKVVAKTGKPVILPAFTPGTNMVKWTKDLLKQHGIKDKETVYDPRSGKTIPNVFVGNQYMLKLMKSTDTNYSARGVEGYDMNQMPTKGGVNSAKALGKMEVDALLSHGARNILKDAVTVKSQKNDEFWRALQLGYPTPVPKTTFATNKFLNMLTGAGVRVNRDSSKVSLGPLTDDDVVKMSSGEIKEPKIIRAKDLMPERGGLFDPAITGGLKGEKWSHINLAEPVINPVFKEPVRRLLGMTNSELDNTLKEHGGKHIKKLLSQIDLDKKEKEIRATVKTKSADHLDNEVKQLKYIRALKKLNLTPDKAYVISKVPVTPPVVRPVVPSKGGKQILYGDANPLYQDLLYINNQVKEITDPANPEVPGELAKLRPALQDAVGAVYGTNEPVTTKSQARGHKGFLTYIAGKGSPKYGYFQRNLVRKTQDVTGRGTIIPDVTLGMDEVGIPEDMLWTMYDKFLIRRLVNRGYPALNAKQMIDARHPVAKEALVQEAKDRPVLINRAPTLHRYNIVAAFPRLVPGKTIRVNPFVERASNSDYDGDSCDSHLEFIIGNRYNRLHISECPHNKESVVMKGNKEIYEVPKGVFVFGFNEEDQCIKLREVTHFSVHHGLEMVEVKTRTGRKVKVSRDHSMLGLNPQTGYMERFKAEEGIGWGIPRPRQLFTTQQLDRVFLGDKDVLDSALLTKDLGWFIGAWAGDGWVGHDNRHCLPERRPMHIGLSSVYPEVRDHFVQIAQSYIPDVCFHEYTNEHLFDGVKCVSKKTHINNRPFARAFNELIEGCRGSENKKLPSYFVRGPREFLLGLLGGLLDTDGTVSIVKAKSKKKPQFIVAYTTMSDALADHVGILATMLGIKSNVCKYQKKKEGNWYNAITLSAPDVAKIAHEIPCVHAVKRKHLDLLGKEIFADNNGAVQKNDIVPIPKEIAKVLRYLYSPKGKVGSKTTTEQQHKMKTRYTTLSYAAKNGYLSRCVLKDVVNFLGEEVVRNASFGNWFDLVTNENILWDFVQNVTQLEGLHDAWDLTVPEGNTFMTSNQLLVYDTMQVHAPVSHRAVEEAKGLTLSNLLYGDQSKNSLYVTPQHETVLGMDKAMNADDQNKPIVFKNKGEAMHAYQKGEINMGTRVVIGKKK